MELNYQAYLPWLSNEQCLQLQMLERLIVEENEKVNLISRKEHEFVSERHILHSLAIAHYAMYPDGVLVVDIGTGGGFPAIPLAIAFPKVNFLAIDSIGKKIASVHRTIENLGLKNVTAEWMRAESFSGRADAAVTRAVAPLDELMKWSSSWLKKTNAKPEPWQGLLALKGGDLKEEMHIAKIALPHMRIKVMNIYDAFPVPFFETKKLVQAWLPTPR